MTPIGLFIPWPWEKAFLGISSISAAQSSMPSKAGILKRRVPDCFGCSTFRTKSRKLFALMQPFPFSFLDSFFLKKQPAYPPEPSLQSPSFSLDLVRSHSPKFEVQATGSSALRGLARCTSNPPHGVAPQKCNRKNAQLGLECI